MGDMNLVSRRVGHRTRWWAVSEVLELQIMAILFSEWSQVWMAEEGGKVKNSVLKLEMEVLNL